MERYTFRKLGELHGMLTITDEQGRSFEQEIWSEPTEEYLQRLAAMPRKPGQRFPSGDPRLYTHCQWCGETVDPYNEKTVWHYGQFHYERCYKPNREEIWRG